MIRLSTLLAGAGIEPIDPPTADPEIAEIRVDSRRVGSGDVFAALPGTRADGAEFAAEAVARGAAAIVAEVPRPPDFPAGVGWIRVRDGRRAAARLARERFARPDLAMALVGITGTNGKTTVSYLVESIARAAGAAPGRIGTNGHAFAGVETAGDRTTPEATELYALLARMRDAGTTVVAMEVSSHALTLRRVEGARFAVAAFLNLGRDHLDFHGTIDAYFEAKASLFDNLDPRAVAVLPADDPRGDALARRTRARVVTWGRSEGADVRLLEETHGLDGSRGRILAGGREIEVVTGLVGRVNLENVLAAAACAVGLGFPVEAIPRGVAALPSVPGRLERVEGGQPFSVLVDYAHTPNALAAALDAVRAAAPRRLGVVFGCGGDRDRGKRPEMGRVAAERADALWLTSDNPRGEDPQAILAAILAGVERVPDAPGRTRVEPDRTRAIEAAVAWAAEGDALLVAGKGHETVQVFADRTVPFDDRDVVRSALERRGWGAA